jgi:cytochrome b subunit of formate dehydrogenase
VGANVNFAATFDHTPITLPNKPIEFIVLMIYRALTLCTFMAFGFFMLLDVMTMVRSRVFNHERHHKPKKVRFVVRLSKALRIQHFVVLATTIILFLTAWPLLSPQSPAAQAFTHALGGAKSIAWIHRIAGLTMISGFIYHLFYLYQQYRKGYRKFPLMPEWKDLQDMVNIGLYFLGIRAEKPQFKQFAFYEKFEYWAVCFGSGMMGATGLILMFPILVSRLLPGRAISIATVIHWSEALLAAVVLMIWHFYNVHMKPGIFPMNWSWLTGRMSTHQYEEEHAAHVEELRKEGKWEEDEE